jgi:hypothetical protein
VQLIIAITAMLSLIIGLAVAGVIGIAIIASQLADLKVYIITMISLLQDIAHPLQPLTITKAGEMK